MHWPSFVWIIAVPIVTSPIVYLVGRILQRALEGLEARGGIPAALRTRGRGRSWRANPVRWIGFAVLAASCVPFVLAWKSLARGNVETLTYGIISLRFDGISLLLSAAVLSLAEIRTMVNEMLEKNRDYLPTFGSFRA